MISAEKSALAGEYVLGTLPEAERRAVQLQLVTDAELAAEVAAWEGRLHGLDASAQPVEPPAGVWMRIEAQIRRPAIAAAPDTREDALRASLERTAIERLRRRVSAWRTTAALSGALAAGLAAFLIARPPVVEAPAGGQRYVAVVSSEGNLPPLLVDVDTATGIINVVSVAAEAPPGRSYELWYIGENRDPLSLGLVDEIGGRLSVPIGAVEGFMPAAAVFAITEEAPGGSSTGAPQGPIVYTGELILAPGE